MNYREERTDAGASKKAYVDGIDKLIKNMQISAEKRRAILNYSHSSIVF